jgi:hypothetical protein
MEQVLLPIATLTPPTQSMRSVSKGAVKGWLWKVREAFGGGGLMGNPQDDDLESTNYSELDKIPSSGAHTPLTFKQRMAVIDELEWWSGEIAMRLAEEDLRIRGIIMSQATTHRQQVTLLQQCQQQHVGNDASFIKLEESTVDGMWCDKHDNQHTRNIFNSAESHPPYNFDLDPTGAYVRYLKYSTVEPRMMLVDWCSEVLRIL